MRNGEVGAGGTVVSSWQLPAFDLHKGKEGVGGGNGYDLFSKFLTAFFFFPSSSSFPEAVK